MNLYVSRVFKPVYVYRAVLTATVLAASLQAGGARADEPRTQPLGPEYWDRWHKENCDQVLELRAHGVDGDTPLVVPADQELKTKVHFDSGWGDEPVQVVAITPLVDNARVLADFSLFASPTTASRGDTRQVFEWFPGLQRTEAWTNQAGISLPKGSNLTLELHYYNVGGQTQIDRSGVKLCLLRGARQYPLSMGVADLGVPDASVPRRTSKHVVTRTCTARSHQPVSLLSAKAGMHRLGTGWTMVIEKADGTPSLTIDESYRFGEQRGFRLYPDLLVEEGDRITTSCIYDNPTDEDVESGWQSLSEVCRINVAYYPEGALICN